MKGAFLSFIFIFSFSFSYGQIWDWGAAGYGGTLKSSDYGSPVTTDKNGNAFITGYFESRITFGSYTLTGGNANSFLVKYNSAGTVLWAVQSNDSIGGSCYPSSVATDKSGNIYICGYFLYMVKFGTFILSADAYYSAFLVKYSPSGNVLWAKQTISPNENCYGNANSVTTDNSGNIFITGNFRDSVSFGAHTLTGYIDGSTVFLTKYDSSGNVLCASQSDMPSNSCSGYGISVTSDNMGNAYVTGYFETAIFFGSYDLISLNNNSTFLAKYSSGGNLLWAKQSVNINTISSYGYGYSTITDRENNSYITGLFEDSVKFDSYILYSPSSVLSIFFTKYDSNGNVLWAKQSSEGWESTALSSDTLNNIYLGGRNYNSDSTLMFGGFSLDAVPWASSNAFIIKFDTSGMPICGSILENLGGEPGINSDPSGNFIYIAGTFFDDTIKCGNDTLVSNTGDGNPFVGRWLDCSQEEGINTIKSPTPSVTLFPNPNNGEFTIQVKSEELRVESNIEIYNVMGQKVLTETLPSAQGDNSIDLTGQPSGIYLYRLITESGALIGEGKVIIEK